VHGSGKYRYELVDGWARLPENESILDACSVDIDSRDRICVLTRGTNPIMIFDRDGNFLNSWGAGSFVRVHGGCVGPDDTIYFTDADGNAMYRFTLNGEQLLHLTGEGGNPSNTGFSQATMEKMGIEIALQAIRKSGPPFNLPTDVSISSSGDIFVSDGYGNAGIHRFSPKGVLLSSFGEPGRGPGQFRVPHCVWIDRYERIWVADRENNRIQIFDIEGTFLAEWTDFIRPCDIFIDKDEVVYVSELSRRISILDGDGRLMARITCNEEDKQKAILLGPHGITVDSRGDIYVGEVAMAIAHIDRRGRAVQKFARI
jgi:streptogramin lyase